MNTEPIKELDFPLYEDRNYLGYECMPFIPSYSYEIKIEKK